VPLTILNSEDIGLKCGKHYIEQKDEYKGIHTSQQRFEFLRIVNYGGYQNKVINHKLEILTGRVSVN